MWIERIQKQNKKEYGILLAVVVFLIFTVGIYAPLEMYLLNIDEFWFKLSMFIFLPISIAVLVGILLISVGILLGNKAFDNYVAVIFGFAVAIYIQGNFLNLDVGVLNGASIDWGRYTTNFVWNLILWVFLIAVPIIGVNLKAAICKKVMCAAGLLLTMMQMVSLVVLLLTCGVNDVGEEDNKQMHVSDKNLFDVSEDENVVVFLLDMFDNRYFDSLLQFYPELEDSLSGFTRFANSTGNYSTTSYSIGTLMTGQYFYNQEPFSNQLNTAYAQSLMFKLLSENGYRLDCYTYGSCAPSDMWEDTSNYIEGQEEIKNYPLFARYLYQTVMCKYMPNILKPYIWMDGTEFNTLKTTGGEYESYDTDNSIFYEALKKNGISTQNQEKCFKFIHINGAHYPYNLNKKIEKVEESETSELECAWGAFQIVLKYMDEMQAKNVYDNSSIIIMADHGYYWDGVLTNPVLLVKPKGASGSMEVSNAPVSHHDFQPSVLYLTGLNNDKEYGDSYFDIKEGEKRERLFYQYYLREDNIEGNYRLIEYEIDPEGNKRENFHLTNVEYLPDGKKIPHKENCEYCQSGAEDPIETEENAPITIVHNSLNYK